MKNDGWEKAKKIFGDAIKVAPELRLQYLDEVCEGDADTRREVESLLASFDDAESFMEQPAAKEVASLIVEPNEKLQSGQQIAHYEIIRQIGAGGMGEVYLAEDIKLKRKVALKLLNKNLSRNQEHLRRFVQEARAASALNHPNIITIYEIGDTEEGTHFIAAEYIKGKTLREYLRRDEIGLRRILEIADQIASALAATHASGIIHRDIKPENIMLREDGLVKILDFGVAKLIEKQPEKLDTEAETRAQMNTAVGVILGTVLYMSPEQARGKEIDARTDVWSLGVVLYEMFTGHLPFVGETMSDIIAAILERDPLPLAEHRRDAPPELERIISRALAKSKEKRYAEIVEMANDLRKLQETPGSLQPVNLNLPTLVQNPQPTISRSQKPLALTALLVLIFGAIAVGYFVWQSQRVKQNAPLSQQRLISTFAGSHSASSFSPDGNSIAFINELNGVAQVWIKKSAADEPTQITFGEENAERPRWSPDGSEIAYVRRTKGTPSIYFVSPEGGAARKVIEGGRNPNWSWNGKQLVFERAYGVWTANRDGSDQRRVEGVPATDLLLADRMPAFSPDGSLIAFFQNDKGPIGDYWVVPVSGGQARRLTSDNIHGGSPMWMPGGESIIFPSQRAGSMTLWRIPVAGGQPESVLASAGEDTEPAISRDGRKLIYTNTRNSYILTLTNPTTGESNKLRESRVDMVDPSFSPDGNKIVFFGISEEGDIHIFTIGSDGKNLAQITRGKGERNIHPQWSHDGATIYFYQFHPTVSFRKISSSGGESVELVQGWQWGTHNGAQVDPEGKRIIYSKLDKGSVAATMIRDIATGTETAFSLPLRHARWSHDGKFIIGTDVPGGRWNLAEITVCSIDNKPCRKVIRGYSPHWSHDDLHIYYNHFSNLKDGEEVWKVSSEGGNTKKIIDLQPLHPIGNFFDASPQGEIVWIEYQRGKHELWLAEFPAS